MEYFINFLNSLTLAAKLTLSANPFILKANQESIKYASTIYYVSMSSMSNSSKTHTIGYKTQPTEILQPKMPRNRTTKKLNLCNVSKKLLVERWIRKTYKRRENANLFKRVPYSVSKTQTQANITTLSGLHENKGMVSIRNKKGKKILLKTVLYELKSTDQVRNSCLQIIRRPSNSLYAASSYKKEIRTRYSNRRQIDSRAGRRLLARKPKYLLNPKSYSKESTTLRQGFQWLYEKIGLLRYTNLGIRFLRFSTEIHRISTSYKDGIGTVFLPEGDPFNPNPRLACLHRNMKFTDMVVAHRTLPCNSRVYVWNIRTRLGAMATVGDRGPKRALVDLNYAVAKAIHHNGKEKVVVVSPYWRVR